MPTPNFGWNTPLLPAPNNVPADLLGLATQIDASLKAVETALTLGVGLPYAVTWGGTDGSTLAIGNGTLAGRYIQQGKQVFFSILLVRGSTSNVGNSAYTFTVPVAPRSYREIQASGYVTAGASSEVPVAVRGIGSSRIVILAPTGRVSNTLPGGWAVGNEIFVSGFYEAG